MTLRTIELPDGRRFTRLIPCHDGGGEMPYDDDEKSVMRHRGFTHLSLQTERGRTALAAST
jgi:hypothetical protein